MLNFKRNKNRIMVGVVTIGVLACAVGGYLVYTEKVAEAQMRSVYVAAKDILMYQEITSNDLKITKISPQQDVSPYAIQKNDLVGKVAQSNLYASAMIPKKALKDSKEMSDTVFVTVYTSYTQSGGAKPGDRVMVSDMQEQINGNTRTIWETVLAKDARVISVTNLNGQDAYQKAKDSLVNGTIQVQAVKLAVKASEIVSAPALKSGAVDKENRLVLTVLYDDAEVPAVPQAITPVVLPVEEPKAEAKTPVQKKPAASTPTVQAPAAVPTPAPPVTQ